MPFPLPSRLPHLLPPVLQPMAPPQCLLASCGCTVTDRHLEKTCQGGGACSRRQVGGLNGAGVAGPRSELAPCAVHCDRNNWGSPAPNWPSRRVARGKKRCGGTGWHRPRCAALRHALPLGSARRGALRPAAFVSASLPSAPLGSSPCTSESSPSSLLVCSSRRWLAGRRPACCDRLRVPARLPAASCGTTRPPVPPGPKRRRRTRSSLSCCRPAARSRVRGQWVGSTGPAGEKPGLRAHAMPRA